MPNNRKPVFRPEDGQKYLENQNQVSPKVQPELKALLKNAPINPKADLTEKNDYVNAAGVFFDTTVPVKDLIAKHKS